ncbi:riboflavin synthase alpha chain [Palleronia aestuarii]|uniref:Riboflavin synthase n=1 Tax=Palleronia aestuarii TaxID=568105 RepID=A0A2W7NHB3_9RHOB|nr:riboflavin synthase [Palleronia aestuarii]PZX16064.1 riboflavin synthase alpha chain [Palleronia aestuarii]
MFTGLVSDVGEVLSVHRDGDLRARIGCSYDVEGIAMGASIACDGICLTVIASGTDPRTWFEVEMSAETSSKTNAGHCGWPVGRRINLERSLRLGDELGGHIVSGHVDGVAEIVDATTQDGSTRYTLRAPDALAKFIAPKGSVALNGTSLTVNEVDGALFGVNLIPHTKEATTWGQAKPGDMVNLEVDTMARYVARLQEMA